MTGVDVTIVAYGDGFGLEEAVRRARAVPGVASVVVVDHNPPEAAATLEDVTLLVDRSNPGFGAGQNRAVAGCGAPYVLLLNPDARIEPDEIRRGAELLDAHPDVGAVQGTIVNDSTGQPERSHGVELAWVHLWGRALGLRTLLSVPLVQRVFARSRLLGDHVERVPVAAADVEWLAATALLVRRSAFEQVGGFDDSFFLYGEDLDLCRRLNAAGWRLVAVPETWARHQSGGSSANKPGRETAWWEGTMRFAARWWTTPQYAMGLAAACIAWTRVAMSDLHRSPTALRRMVLASLAARVTDRAG